MTNIKVLSRDEVKKLSDNAYCEYARIIGTYPCLGFEAKIKAGEFGQHELSQHTLASEWLGKHRAYHEILRMMDAHEESAMAAGEKELDESGLELRCVDLGVPPHPREPAPKDKNRCAVCGWPLKERVEDGCIRGNCSQRPLPKIWYDAERASREGYGHRITEPDSKWEPGTVLSYKHDARIRRYLANLVYKDNINEQWKCLGIKDTQVLTVSEWNIHRLPHKLKVGDWFEFIEDVDGGKGPFRVETVDEDKVWFIKGRLKWFALSSEIRHIPPPKEEKPSQETKGVMPTELASVLINRIRNDLRVALETINGWVKDSTGRVYVSPVAILKAVNAANISLYRLIETVLYGIDGSLPCAERGCTEGNHKFKVGDWAQWIDHLPGPFQVTNVSSVDGREMLYGLGAFLPAEECCHVPPPKEVAIEDKIKNAMLHSTALPKVRWDKEENPRKQALSELAQQEQADGHYRCDLDEKPAQENTDTKKWEAWKMYFDEYKNLIVRADSLLSLLEHRGYIKHELSSCPESIEVQQLIGDLRNAAGRAVETSEKPSQERQVMPNGAKRIATAESNAVTGAHRAVETSENPFTGPHWGDDKVYDQPWQMAMDNRRRTRDLRDELNRMRGGK